MLAPIPITVQFSSYNSQLCPKNEALFFGPFISGYRSHNKNMSE